MRADAIGLHKMLQTRIKLYRCDYGKDPSISAIAQLLSNTLYGRRFFPYYTFNLLCGIDDEGKGAVFGYDAIGSYQRENSGAMGSASQLVIPILDNQIKDFNNLNPVAPTDKEATINLIKDTLHSASERDIYTGDNVEICVITKDGVEIKSEPLRRD